MKKYSFTGETKYINGQTLYRIRAERDFANVKKGDLGGWIATEINLSHNGCAWVYDNARVCDNAQVIDHAFVGGNAVVIGNALVEGNVVVSGDAGLGYNAKITQASDYMCVSNVGSRYSVITFYRTDNGISVTCGCFNNTLDAFLARAEKICGQDVHGAVYRALADAAKAQILGGSE